MPSPESFLLNDLTFLDAREGDPTLPLSSSYLAPRANPHRSAWKEFLNLRSWLYTETMDPVGTSMRTFGILSRSCADTNMVAVCVVDNQRCRSRATTTVRERTTPDKRTFQISLNFESKFSTHASDKRDDLTSFGEFSSNFFQETLELPLLM